MCSGPFVYGTISSECLIKAISTRIKNLVLQIERIGNVFLFEKSLF